jgi:hypothetical protein
MEECNRHHLVGPTRCYVSNGVEDFDGYADYGPSLIYRANSDDQAGNETAQHSLWTQNVEALTYQAEFVALWIAAGTMLLSILTVSSLFYGYWRLKRPVSLSPLETGQALAAVIMSEPTGDLDMNIEQLLGVIGDKKTR